MPPFKTPATNRIPKLLTFLPEQLQIQRLLCPSSRSGSIIHKTTHRTQGSTYHYWFITKDTNQEEPMEKICKADVGKRGIGSFHALSRHITFPSSLMCSSSKNLSKSCSLGNFMIDWITGHWWLNSISSLWSWDGAKSSNPLIKEVFLLTSPHSKAI